MRRLLPALLLFAGCVAQVTPRTPEISDQVLAAYVRHIYDPKLSNEEREKPLGTLKSARALAEISLRRSPVCREAVSGILAGSQEYWHTLDLLTALRRIEGRTDPLTMTATTVWGRVEYEYPEPVEVLVTFTNTDPEGRTFSMSGPGPTEYHFRFDVRNEQGERLPLRRDGLDYPSSGLGEWKDLKAGQSWSRRLMMQCFLETLRPGRYTVRVQYSESSQIATLADPEGTLYVESPPFTLVVHDHK